MRRAFLRLQLQHLPELLRRRTRLPHLHQQFAQVQERMDIARIRPQFFDEMLPGIGQQPLRPNASAMHMHLRMLRLQGQHLLPAPSRRS